MQRTEGSGELYLHSLVRARVVAVAPVHPQHPVFWFCDTATLALPTGSRLQT
jgi:hypothetical protein